MSRSGIKCSGCGKFIAYDDMQRSLASCHVTPDSHFTSELIEWVCAKCTEKALREHEERLTQWGVLDR